MRVCYFGTYRNQYSRNRIMIEGLRQNDVQVMECHEPLWKGIEDRIQTVRGGWRTPRFWLRIFRVYWQLIRHYMRMPEHDVVVVGYPGQLDVYLARFLTLLRRKPLMWDIFMSVYLIAVERKLDRVSRLGVWLLRMLEWFACRLPDGLIIDTDEYAHWFEDTYGVAATKFAKIPTGADDRIFQRTAKSNPCPNDKMRILYYGTFIPNHGVLTMIEAARLLTDEPNMHFEFVGDGPEKGLAEEIARRYDLENVTFIDWLTPESLREYIARAHICLGAFGVTPQSLMTVQNKIYECLAMAKPVVTGDGPAVRRLFVHGQHVWLCPRNDPAALADSLRILCEDPERLARLGEEGWKHFQANFTVYHIGAQFKTQIDRLVKEHAGQTKR